jgi:hypothetical protein
VSVAGAPPGLQNRGDDSVSHNPSTQLRNLPTSLAAQGKRAARNQAPLDAPKDPDLAAVVEAWPDLPEALKAGIVAMVKAALLNEYLR